MRTLCLTVGEVSDTLKEVGDSPRVQKSGFHCSPFTRRGVRVFTPISTNESSSPDLRAKIKQKEKQHPLIALGAVQSLLVVFEVQLRCPVTVVLLYFSQVCYYQDKF